MADMAYLHAANESIVDQFFEQSGSLIVLTRPSPKVFTITAVLAVL